MKSLINSSLGTDTEHMPCQQDSKLQPLKFSSLICFTLALIICLIQNLSHSSLEMASLFDSGKYVGSCQQLIVAGNQLTQELKISTFVKICHNLSDSMMLDGPVLPLIGTSVYVLLKQSPTVLDMRIPIVVEGVFQAICALLVCLLGTRLTGSRKWGLLFGLAWALYPSAVIGAGKFLTEIPTIAFLLGLIFCLSTIFDTSLSAKKLFAAAYVSGLLTAISLLAKPALLFALAATSLIALLQLTSSRSKIIVSCALISGALTIFAPWCTYTKIATGQIYLTPQREPAGNLAVGCNLETDGWGTKPDTAFFDIFHLDPSPAADAWGIISTQPATYLNLFLRKVPRLWAFPWNDYRNKFFSIGAVPQILWHQFLGIIAIFGIFAFFAQSNLLSAKQKFIGYASLSMMLGPFTYILFAANSRYGFTSMPFAIIFAGYAAALLFSNRAHWKSIFAIAMLTVLLICLLPADLFPFLKLPTSNIRFFAITELIVKLLALLAVLSSFFIIASRSIKSSRPSVALKTTLALTSIGFSSILIAFAFDEHNVREWACTLNSEMSANREISMPSAQQNGWQKPGWALVVFDAAGIDKSGNPKIYVNKIRLQDTPKPLYLYNSTNDLMANYQIYSSTCKISTKDFRQWQAVKVPLNLLNNTSTNLITIASNNKQPFTLFGDYPAFSNQRAKTLSFSMFSTTKLLNAGNEPRVTDPYPLAKVDSKNWLSTNNQSIRNTDNLSPSWNRRFGQYRLFLVLGYPNAKSIDNKKSDTINKEMPASLSIDPNTGFSKAERLTDNFFHKSHLSVIVKGLLASKETGANTSVSVAVRSISATGNDYYLPNSPLELSLSPVWKNFELKGEIPCAVLSAGQKAVHIFINPNQHHIKLKDLSYEVKPQQEADFTSSWVQVL